MVDVKDFHARVKATGDDADTLSEGQFDALVSVFGNEDSTGDVVIPGAFTKSLARWDERGDPIPVIWAHEWSDPYAHIGHVTTAEETDDGLRVRGQLDLDNPKAKQVYRLLKGRRVTQFSFAFDVHDSAATKRGDRSVTELRELAVHEVGPCLMGANQETDLLAAKARQMGVDASSVRLHDVAALRAAYDALGALLESTETTDTDEEAEPDSGADDVSGPEEEAGQGEAEAAADETGEAGKSAAQPRPAPAQVLASLTVKRLAQGAEHEPV